jgi:hypothetical protein
MQAASTRRAPADQCCLSCRTKPSSKLAVATKGWTCDLQQSHQLTVHAPLLLWLEGTCQSACARMQDPQSLTSRQAACVNKCVYPSEQLNTACADASCDCQIEVIWVVFCVETLFTYAQNINSLAFNINASISPRRRVSPIQLQNPVAVFKKLVACPSGAELVLCEEGVAKAWREKGKYASLWSACEGAKNAVYALSLMWCAKPSVSGVQVALGCCECIASTMHRSWLEFTSIDGLVDGGMCCK